MSYPLALGLFLVLLFVIVCYAALMMAGHKIEVCLLLLKKTFIFFPQFSLVVIVPAAVDCFHAFSSTLAHYLVSPESQRRTISKQHI